MSGVMVSPEESLDADLFAHLARIDARVQQICDEGYALDPCAVMAAIQDETVCVQDCVEQLMRNLESRPRPYTNLNQVVDVASQEFLLATTTPVVIRVKPDRSLPELCFVDEIALAVVLRALHLCVEHIGAGCEVSITTRAKGFSASVEIEARGLQAQQEPSIPIKVRSISLSDLVRSFGGGFHITQHDGVITVEVSFTASTPAT